MGSASVVGNEVTVFVKWGQTANPEPGFDFNVAFDDPNNPAIDDYNPKIELMEGNLCWEVYSENVSDGTPANIGVLTINPNSSAENFNVRIAGPFGNEGADHVGTIDLTSSNWTGHSSISADGFPSQINFLNGDLTLRGSSEAGGVLGSLLVHHDVTGNIYAPVLGHVLVIEEDSGNIESEALQENGQLTLFGGLLGDLTIDGMGAGSQVRILEQVSVYSNIYIGDMGIASLLRFGDPSNQIDMRAQLFLANGVPVNAHVEIWGETVDYDGSIDLNGGLVAGKLFISRGGNGTINGGAVSGKVYLATADAAGSHSYSGTATFASVTSTGLIQTTGDADLSGTVAITGACEGHIAVGRNLSGSVSIGAGLADNTFSAALEPPGVLSVGGDLSGSLDVTGHCGGDVLVAGGVPGLIRVNRSLQTPGRILVEGLLHGGIVIGLDTAADSLIQVREGISSVANIQVNENRRDGNDANGDIRIGAVTAATPVTFNGTICIHEGVSGSGGNLNGSIQVLTCPTSNPVSICVDGAVNGSVDIICALPVTWSCVTACP